ncbi:hypothetical protein V2I01_42960 [Micromonospora sp. BRA006-A]|nr:hypothetical protein [Micromonospora sp. BRA006-A]
MTASLPGPLGLPGGYPVRLTGGRTELRLPAELPVAQAVAWNTAAGRRDGVEVGGGHVRYRARPGGAGGVPAGPGRRLARERAARDRLPVHRPA